MDNITEFRELSTGDICHLGFLNIRRIIAKMIFDCYRRSISPTTYNIFISIGENVFRAANFCRNMNIEYTIDVGDDQYDIYISKNHIKIINDSMLMNVIKVTLVPKYLVGFTTSKVIFDEFINVNINNDKLNIKKVIFHKPATIVYWIDGSKTVVKVNKGERWDPEKGLAMAIIKKKYGLKQFLKYIE